MYVIEVIPLKRGIFTESLSYYSGLNYKEGTLLSIPVRNVSVMAMVVSSKPVSVAKTALKTATFSLRKLAPQSDARSLPQSLIATAQSMSTIIPAHTGSLLFAMLPPDIRDGQRKYPDTTFQKNTEDCTPRILTDTSVNRFIAYRSHIRQTFAHRGSVVFIVPTAALVEQARKKLEVGIENRVITFSSSHSKKQLDLSYAAFEDLRQAKLIIATPSYAFLERHDITAIIVESCGSSNYLSRVRPYLDIRELLKHYAKQTGRSLLFGDTLPKTEDEIQRREDIYATHDEHTKRLELQGSLEIVRHKQIVAEEKFSLCTPELIEILNRSLAAKGHVFLFAARRGLAPAVTCFDCGYLFRCPDSGAPYFLLRTYKGEEEQRWFVSGTSGKRVRAADVCPSCGSWRLKEQGIGIQQVYDEIKKLYPRTEIFVFDHTTATTSKKAGKIIEGFYEAKRAILIGTHMCLPYISKPINTSAIMSYEATRTVPTWRADETIFSLLLTLREITMQDVVIQMRTDPDELIELARRGLVDQFYDGEIEVRNALKYPPYSIFVLVSWAGSKEQVQIVEDAVKGALGGYEVQTYSAPQSNEHKTLRYGLLRIDAKAWPDPKLMHALRSLPPYIKIEINPDRIV